MRIITIVGFLELLINIKCFKLNIMYISLKNVICTLFACSILCSILDTNSDIPLLIIKISELP